MAETRRITRVFLASPGDLAEERLAVRAVVTEVNYFYLSKIGHQAEVIGWEDAVPKFGRPQAIINRELESCEIFIGVLWRKWGTPPDLEGRYSSGFEEEYRTSLQRRITEGKPEISIFFKKIDGSFLFDPGPDLKKVLEFKQHLISEKIALFQEFDDLSDFKSKFRRCLIEHIEDLHNHERGPDKERSQSSAPRTESAHTAQFASGSGSSDTPESGSPDREFVGRGISGHCIPFRQRERRPSPIMSRRRATSCLLSLAAIISGGTYYSFQSHSFSTGIGEQRTITLGDGTQVALNSASRINVVYTDQKRLVQMKSGEALFFVAKQANLPFIVTIGDHKATVLGTSFHVRLGLGTAAVALLEGQIAVEPALRMRNTSSARVRTLSPGERVTFRGNATLPVLDRPPLNTLTSFLRGRVEIVNMTLADAILEMNRHNTVQLEVQGERAAAMRVSGSFRIGDSREFAKLVARVHGLQVKTTQGRILLIEPPDQQYRVLPPEPFDEQ